MRPTAVGANFLNKCDRQSRFHGVKLTLATAFSVVGAPFLFAATPQEEIAAQVPAARQILDAWQAAQPEKAEKKVHIVYWSPSDREPCPGHRERLTAIMEDIRDFYAREMQRLGFGPLTIHLDYAADGKLNIHEVHGSQPYAKYDVESGGPIRNECLATLRAAGLNPERETCVIFCNMANWDPAQRIVSQNSPYYASGTNRQGTAWQVDSPILDLASLALKEPRVKDGQYGNISIGRYNSIFIGGVCHELGHALGLPHNQETPEEKKAFGTALMGSGNRSYGEDRRGEGQGSFLTLAHGLRLASHPIFCGSVKGIAQRPDGALQDVKLENRGKTFTFSAKVTADPPAYAVIGYMDPDGGGDYDATTCTAIPDADGRITLQADALQAGKSGVLRVVVCQANGAASSFASASTRFTYPYRVAPDGAVDLSSSQARLQLAPLLKALDQPTAGSVASSLKAIEGLTPAPDAGVLETARVLAASADFTPGPPPAAAEGASCHLSEATLTANRVGYGHAQPNRLPDDGLFSCGARLFARGLYAHAPARQTWDLGGRWTTLSGHAGLPDGNDGGSCVFVIRADGKELWRSKKTESGTLRDYELNVAGVKELELTVEDAGDGNGADWGCWFDPVVKR